MLKRSAPANDDNSLADVNISPLIDIVFLLLIFFMVTAVFVEETGVEIRKPQALSAAAVDKTAIMLALDADGGVHFDGRPVSAHGVRGLVARLLRDEERPVIVIADEASSTGDLVRIIDECKLGGASVVSVAATAQGRGSR